MALDLTVLSKAMQDWAETQLAGAKVIWADQGGIAPAHPYATLKIISGPDRIGLDESRVTESGTLQHIGHRRLTLSINTYGPGAMTMASKLLDSLAFHVVRDAFAAFNLVPQDTTAVRDITTQLDRVVERRANLEVIFAATSVSTETIDLIEKVRFAGWYFNDDGIKIKNTDAGVG